MDANWEPGSLLLETWIDLACAVRAYPVNYDQIIGEHIKSAFERLDAARLKAIEEECNVLER